MAKKQSKPTQVKLTPKELESLLKEITESNLGDIAKKVFEGLIDLNGWLTEQLEEGKLSINKLKRLFACISEPNNKKIAKLRLIRLLVIIKVMDKIIVMTILEQKKFN